MNTSLSLLGVTTGSLGFPLLEIGIQTKALTLVDPNLSVYIGSEVRGERLPSPRPVAVFQLLQADPFGLTVRMHEGAWAVFPDEDTLVEDAPYTGAMIVLDPGYTVLKVAGESIRFCVSHRKSRPVSPGIVLQVLSQKVIDARPVSLRLRNGLLNQNIRWVGDLVQRTAEDLIQGKDMESKSLEEAQEILAELSADTGIALSLGMVPEQLHGWRPPRG